MIAVYITLAVILFLLLLLVFLIFPAARKHPDRALLKGAYIAHRGYHGVNAPENSIPAFKAAIEKGLIIETDIHILKDGEVVVFHDDDLKRMCGDERNIEDLTLAEVKKLRLKDSDEQIPSFREFLEVVDGKVPFLLELKTVSPKTCKPLCSAANEILKDYKGKYFVQSFYPPAVFWYRRHRKDIMRGQLASWKLKNKGLEITAVGTLLCNVLARPDFVAYDYHFKNNFFRRLCVLLGAHSAGWTFRDKEAVKQNKKDFSTIIFEGFEPEN